jgi:hypothetical protein
MSATQTQTIAVPEVKLDETVALLARIAELEQKLTLKAINEGSGVKLTAKGSLSMYGLGHFPVTLTYTQWLIVSKNIAKLLAFGVVNQAKLFFKSDEQREQAFPVVKA